MCHYLCCVCSRVSWVGLMLSLIQKITGFCKFEEFESSEDVWLTHAHTHSLSLPLRPLASSLFDARLYFRFFINYEKSKNRKTSPV